MFTSFLMFILFCIILFFFLSLSSIRHSSFSLFLKLFCLFMSSPLNVDILLAYFDFPFTFDTLLLSYLYTDKPSLNLKNMTSDPKITHCQSMEEICQGSNFVASKNNDAYSIFTKKFTWHNSLKNGRISLLGGFVKLAAWFAWFGL